MASYQPPDEQTAIFNTQNFSASNYDGPSDPNKLDFPNAQGVPTMVGLNVSNGTNTSFITPTGITTSGTQGASIIDIVQIPEKNTANTFTQNQTISDGTNTSVIRATGLTNSGAYNINTSSVNPITTSNTSVLIGSKATFNLGADNTCLGYDTLNGTGNSVMINNTCVGRSAGSVLHTSTGGQSSGNTLVGRSAGDKIVTGYSNTCLGYNAGNAITSGYLNTIIGQGAGGSNVTSGNSNTYIGSGTNATSAGLSNSTAIGANAAITAANQVVLGTSAETVIVPSGFINTSSNNIFFTTNKPSGIGGLNVGVGAGAFQSGNASTTSSTAVGYGSLNNCQSSSNAAVGQYSLPNLSSGSSNTALGYNAGGVNAGTGLTTGTLNTFIGANSNVAAGQTGVSRSTAIGQFSIITASNQIVMGTAAESVALPARHSLGLATQINSSPSITTTTSFTIATIDNGTAGTAGTTMTTIGNPQLQVGMYISVPATTTYCPAGFSGVIITAQTGLNTWTISSAQTVLVNPAGSSVNSGTAIGITASYYLTTYPLFITSIISNVMTITTSTYSPTLPAGTLIFGAGISAGVTVSSGSGTSYTLTNTPNIGSIIGGYSSSSISINFPLSEIYYIVPQATALTITLPTITSINVGAKVTFRTTSTGAGSVSLASLANNIFVSTTLATPTVAAPNTGSHTIYTGGSTALLTHTFICLPTTIGGTAYAYGWFQQGSV
jgi:hypothetical protein